MRNSKKRIYAFCSLILLLCIGYTHGKDNSGNILIVVTNHSKINETETPTGYFLSEVAHPWKEFTDAGYRVHFASPKGGFAPMDPKSFDLNDPANKKLWHDLNAVQSLVHTKYLGDIITTEYDAIFFAGGHGTMWDFPYSSSVLSSITELYENGGVVAAVCHGPAALVNVKLSNGNYLVDGKKVAAFTNSEEDAVKLTDSMPFLLESKLRERGAIFISAPNFSANVVSDQRLVTGQNPASAKGVALKILELLK